MPDDLAALTHAFNGLAKNGKDSYNLSASYIWKKTRFFASDINLQVTKRPRVEYMLSLTYLPAPAMVYLRNSVFVN